MKKILTIILYIKSYDFKKIRCKQEVKGTQ